VRMPVIGNGDVMKPEDARALFEQTGCDAVMIGRAAPTNPWIFRQLADYFSTGRYAEPTETDRYDLIRAYYEMLVEEEMPGAIGKMKQFAGWFTHGVRNGTELRRQVQSAGATHEVLDRVNAFFSAAVTSETDDLAPAFRPAPADPARGVGATMSSQLPDTTL
jgi:tRNA-dihydrouridine synthase B